MSPDDNTCSNGAACEEEPQTNNDNDNTATMNNNDNDCCHADNPNCIPISETKCLLAKQQQQQQQYTSPAPLPSDAPEHSATTELLRKLAAEFTGTALLVLVVVSSGISAQNLTDDVGLQLLINAFATAAGLFGLITVFGPVSGAHFNPVVSLVDVLYRDMGPGHGLWYAASQISGGIVGCVLSNIQYQVETFTISEKERFGYELWISEVLATASLIVVIHGCIRTGSESSVPAVVSLWVGGGYFFTSSSIFANPAVTMGRMFTATFAGIEPQSAAVYMCFQLVGAVLGYVLTRVFYPLHLQPLKKDDNLYRRACVLELKDFYAKGAY